MSDNQEEFELEPMSDEEGGYAPFVPTIPKTREGALLEVIKLMAAQNAILGKIEIHLDSLATSIEELKGVVEMKS